MTRRFLLFFLLTGVMASPALAQAPGDARWNALYDRIVRLEHEMRQMKRQHESRIRKLEAQLRRLQRRGGRVAPPPRRGETVPPQINGNNRRAAADELFEPLPPLNEPRMSVEIAPPAGARRVAPPAAPAAPAVRGTPAAPPQRGGAGGPIALPGAITDALGGAAGAATGGAGLAPGRVEAQPLPPLVGGSAQPAPSGALRTASIPPALGRLSADALLQKAREHFLSRQYAKAEEAYRAWLTRFADRPQAAQVQYELGESLYVQGRFKEAGRAYVRVYQQHPESRLAPAALLRLGQALRRMGRKKEACKTFATLRQRFPDSREARRGAAREEKRAGCKRG